MYKKVSHQNSAGAIQKSKNHLEADILNVDKDDKYVWAIKNRRKVFVFFNLA